MNDELSHLCFKHLIANKDGQRLIELLKESWLSVPTFPVAPEVLSRHGSAEGWGNFRAGEIYLLQRLEALGKDYQAKQEAEQAKAKLG